MFAVRDMISIKYGAKIREGKILEIKSCPTIFVVGFGYAGNYLRLEYREEDLKQWNLLQ